MRLLAQAELAVPLVLEFPPAALVLLIVAVVVVVVMVVIVFISWITSSPPPPPPPRDPQHCESWRFVEQVGDLLTYEFEGRQFKIRWSKLQELGVERIPDIIHPNG